MVVLDQSIDTSTSTGKLILNMLASIAEFENAIRKERQVDGIKKALPSGVQFGRKSKLTNEEVLVMRGKRATGIKIKDLMNEYSLSKASIYRLLDNQAT